jgi:multidrug resistance efflux pump
MDEELKAQFAELQAAFEKQKEEFAAQLKVAKDEADAMKLEGFKAKAQNWAFAGVDINAYASSALKGSVSVEMFDAAMNAAAKALSDKDSAMANMKAEVEGMKEVGAGDDIAKPETDEKAKKQSSFNAALQAAAAKHNEIKVKQ